ncbi:hypothetical protein Ddc_13405 [Ditylenchus destructor]|nr:hypothetical protein Ddc_13405 [Ditylenchus destructor]
MLLLWPSVQGPRCICSSSDAGGNEVGGNDDGEDDDEPMPTPRPQEELRLEVEQQRARQQQEHVLAVQTNEGDEVHLEEGGYQEPRHGSGILYNTGDFTMQMLQAIPQGPRLFDNIQQYANLELAGVFNLLRANYFPTLPIADQLRFVVTTGTVMLRDTETANTFCERTGDVSRLKSIFFLDEVSDREFPLTARLHLVVHELVHVLECLLMRIPDVATMPADYKYSHSDPSWTEVSREVQRILNMDDEIHVGKAPGEEEAFNQIIARNKMRYVQPTQSSPKHDELKM